MSEQAFPHAHVLVLLSSQNLIAEYYRVLIDRNRQSTHKNHMVWDEEAYTNFLCLESLINLHSDLFIITQNQV